MSESKANFFPEFKLPSISSLLNQLQGMPQKDILLIAGMGIVCLSVFFATRNNNLKKFKELDAKWIDAQIEFLQDKMRKESDFKYFGQLTDYKNTKKNLKSFFNDVECGCWGVVLCKITQNPEYIFAQDYYGKNVLHHALGRNQPQIVEQIIKVAQESGVCSELLNMTDVSGRTPLHIAYLHYVERVVKQLEDLGAKEMLDKYDNTPFVYKYNVLCLENIDELKLQGG